MPRPPKQGASPQTAQRAAAPRESAPVAKGRAVEGPDAALLQRLAGAADGSARVAAQRKLADVIQSAFAHHAGPSSPSGALKAEAGQRQAVPAAQVAQAAQAAPTPANDDPSLEREADVMGERAVSRGATAAAGQEDGTVPLQQPAAPAVQRQPVVQRLAGMEVELRIPFYDDGHGVLTDDARFISPNRATLAGAERQAIVDYLYGGLEYDGDYGEVPGRYEITADHTAWKQQHEALRTHINGRHIADPGAKPKMTNLEYRTEPLEERQGASQATMQAIADALQAHALDASGKAVGGVKANLAAPAAARFTGIPEAALTKLLANDAGGMALFNTMKNTLDPSLYFQTTVGALPTEIPTLFTEAAADIDAFSAAHPGNPDMRPAATSHLLKQAVAAAQAAVADGGNAALIGALSAGNRAALTGWLTLVAQTMLAYQLETTNFRYMPDGHGHRVKYGGIRKNLLPYLLKANPEHTMGALPAAARPDMTNAGWRALLQSLILRCDPATTNMATICGLTDYVGQNHHNDQGAVIGPIQHGEILVNQTPAQWAPAMAAGQSRRHVRSGNMVGLDDGQEAERPHLTVRGQQAIPLEDRKTASKASFGDAHNIAGLSGTLMHAWELAKVRRFSSTEDARADYTVMRNRLNPRITGYGNLHTILPAFADIRQKFNALPAVGPADHTLSKIYMDMWHLEQSFNQFRAGGDEAVALLLLRPLIKKPNWDTKGKALWGTKIPDGVAAMQTELDANHDPATTLNNLEQIANARPAKKSGRIDVTGNMYALAKNAPGHIVRGAMGWNAFVVLYNTVNAAV